MSWLDWRTPKVRLELEDFSALVAGKEIEKSGARIILADIGWRNMLAAISRAMNETGAKREAGVATLPSQSEGA